MQGITATSCSSQSGQMLSCRQHLRSPASQRNSLAARAQADEGRSHARSTVSTASRRDALFLAAACFMGSRVSAAQASMEGWDGSSAAVGSCSLDEAGDECRLREVMADKINGSSYASDVSRQGKIGGAITQGVPVSVMDDEYGRATVELAGVIKTYAALDLYNPDRAKAILEIKSEGAKWVSKYARGGSARKQSARKFYIVIDSIQGHFASNGFAPLNKTKLNSILANIDEATKLLAAGK